MKTKQTMRKRMLTVATVLALSAVMSPAGLPAQESSDREKREPQASRESGRPEDSRRDEPRRPGREGEVRTREDQRRQGAGAMEERLRDLDRRIDELNQRLDRMSQSRKEKQVQAERRMGPPPGRPQPGRFGPGFGRGPFGNSGRAFMNRGPERPTDSGETPFMRRGGGRGMGPGFQGPRANAPAPVPAPGPAQDERARRMQHLQAAVENLRAAGMHSAAERLAQEQRRLMNQGSGQPGNPPEGGAMGAPEVERFRAEMQELRQQNQELRRKLESNEQDRRWNERRSN